MPRHKEPEFLRQYWEWTRKGPPRCCHTCIEYADNGMCDKYKMEPPEDFAASTDKCPGFEMTVPF